MRLRLLASALTLATATVPAHAQDTFDAAAAVEGFLTDAATLGATEATVGAVSEADGTVTASDVAIRWTTTFTAQDETATVEATATMPTVDVTGLGETDDGYEADSIEIPTIRLVIDVTGADEPLSYDVTVTDYSLDDASWGAFPTIVANPDEPVSRFAPLVHWALTQSYERNAVGAISTVVVAGDERQELDYGAFAVGPVENGTLAEFNTGELTLTQTTELPDGSGGVRDGEITMTYGPITGRNLDVKPIAELLTGIDAGDGPAVVAENLTAEKFVLEGDDEFRFSMGNVVIDDFTIDASRGPIMTMLDELVVAGMRGEEPDPVTAIGLALDIYGAYGFGLYSIQTIVIATPEFTMTVGDIRTEGLSAEGLDRVAVLDAAMTTETGSGSLGAFETGGFVFPAREAVMDAIVQGMAGATPTPQAMMAVIPTLATVAVRALEVESANAAMLALGNFSLDLGGYIGAIPTEIGIVLEGLVLPAAMLPDPSTAMMAQMIGADPIRADGTLSLRWDADTQRVELDEDVTVGGVGRLQADATLSGIPEVVFADPQRIQEALATAAINGLTLRFEDDGLTEFLLGMISQQSGVAPAEFAEGIAGQVEMQLDAITGDAAFAGDVAGAVRTYLGDPQSLSVSAEPADPVSLAQIMGAAFTAPAALPGLLNFAISANGR